MTKIHFLLIIIMTAFFVFACAQADDEAPVADSAVQTNVDSSGVVSKRVPTVVEITVIDYAERDQATPEELYKFCVPSSALTIKHLDVLAEYRTGKTKSPVTYLQFKMQPSGLVAHNKLNNQIGDRIIKATLIGTDNGYLQRVRIDLNSDPNYLDAGRTRYGLKQIRLSSFSPDSEQEIEFFTEDAPFGYTKIRCKGALNPGKGYSMEMGVCHARFLVRPRLGLHVAFSYAELANWREFSTQTAEQILNWEC